MPEDRPRGIASFDVSLGDRSAEGESAGPRPFRIAVIAELSASPDWSTGRQVPLDPIAIDAESFDRVMGQIAPALAIDVADPFGSREPALRVDLIFRDRKSLRPGEIVEQVPVLRALVAAHRILQDVAARKLPADSARPQLARVLPRSAWTDALVQELRSAPAPAVQAPSPAATPRAAPPAKGGLDALLDMVDVSEPRATRDASPDPAARSEVESLVATVARGARGASTPSAPVGTAVERLESAFQRLLDSILRHAEVRRLEATWRGLRLLVENCERRRGVEVDVICAGRSDVDRALDRLADPDPARPAVDLVVVDQRIEPTAVDLARLEGWAGRTASLLAPLIVVGTASMLGVDELAQAAQTTSALSSSDDARAIAVRAVASREASRWVSVVLNDPLIRTPYSPEAARQQQPPFAQDPAEREAQVFAAGSYVVAALCARNHARLGWPAAIVGARDGRLGNLPVHTVSDRGREQAIPLQAAPTEDALREIARAGLTFLACAPNSDAAILARAPMLHRGGAGSGPSDATLSDQLFVGRFARALQQLAEAIPAGTDPAKVTEVARIALLGMFEGAAPPGPEVTVQVDKARRALEVTVRPHGFAGVQMEEVTLGAALG